MKLSISLKLELVWKPGDNYISLDFGGADADIQKESFDTINWYMMVRIYQLQCNQNPPRVQVRLILVLNLQPNKRGVPTKSYITQLLFNDVWHNIITYEIWNKTNKTQMHDKDKKVIG